MNTLGLANSITADEMADFEEVARLAVIGVPVGPDLLDRIQARSSSVRQEILDRHGIVEIGANIIREMRDSE